MAPISRFIRTTVSAAVACGFLLVFAAPAAFAHDSLKRSSPNKNAKVPGVETIELEYSAHVRFPAVVLLDPAGKNVALGKPRSVDSTVFTDVAAPLAPGGYTIAWRVVSSDGHPIEGEIPFTVTGSGASTSSPAAAARTPSATTVATDEPESRISGWLWVSLAVLVVIGIAVWMRTFQKTRPHSTE
ncbi:copper resistance protein C [Acrocarpospora corrugata]|uniref:Copper resistance protein C n=1 Tax=Acrocarpospora corrugata TaxID=35763 RepID=A0A5M3WA41_9ACTN|nr:copper resistance protein CopC [Acrocarpospora corrugata]GES03368.1 copper resistance protein C [Acrocarpospora corrugata]